MADVAPLIGENRTIAWLGLIERTALDQRLGEERGKVHRDGGRPHLLRNGKRRTSVRFRVGKAAGAQMHFGTVGHRERVAQRRAADTSSRDHLIPNGKCRIEAVAPNQRCEREPNRDRRVILEQLPIRERGLGHRDPLGRSRHRVRMTSQEVGRKVNDVEITDVIYKQVGGHHLAVGHPEAGKLDLLIRRPNAKVIFGRGIMQQQRGWYDQACHEVAGQRVWLQ